MGNDTESDKVLALRLFAQLVDLLGNSQCPCNRLLTSPCARCRVSIRQAQELVAEVAQKRLIESFSIPLPNPN